MPQPASPRYLTKSRFKTALQCPTGLYYTNKPTEYADSNASDLFLQGLAEGGFQVGELAKFLFCEDPVAEKITVAESAYEAALRETSLRLAQPGKVVIAEAAVLFEKLFIRVDILVKEKNTIKLYEVKAKSWDPVKGFWTSKGSIRSNWMLYLQDICFQRHVVQQAFPDYKVTASLILADGESPCSIEGLNQHFKIIREAGTVKIAIKEGTTRTSLGCIPLITIPVDAECDHICSNPVEVDLDGEHSFVNLVDFFADKYQLDERIWSKLGSKCRDCQFSGKENGLKSGFEECWKHLGKLKDTDFERPLALELWGGSAGNKSIVNNVVRDGKLFLDQIKDEDYFSDNGKTYDGLSPFERRKEQIKRRVGNIRDPHLDRPGLKAIFKKLQPPFHFIDFETTMVALPFHKGRRPYEAIAFQYSYHLMQGDGRIEHRSEYLCLDCKFPNYDFVRALRKDLEGKEGTIFRYHHHENNYLNFIYRQLQNERVEHVRDKEELMAFIKQISHNSDKAAGWKGDRDMQDLYKLVLQYYYSPRARGSNSIKDILPSVIHDSPFIREKYSATIYGTDAIPSKNFVNHRWIQGDAQNNPYATLPPVLDGYDNDGLDAYMPGFDDVKDGGAAMMAYAYLQFSEVPEGQKEKISKALLRYCELDTMAMVMIWEYWGREIGYFR